MTISERLFIIMKEKDISISKLSCMTGISRYTIFDWNKKNTNPGSDKIMVICEALNLSPEELLIGKVEEDFPKLDDATYFDNIELQIIRECRELSDSKKKRLLAYMSMLMNTKE